MPNIPGIVGYITPGSFSNVIQKTAIAGLPGGPTVVAILGKGKREEALSRRAVGGGKDGLPSAFNAANQPDGRHFRVSFFPVINGSIELFLNPKGDGTDIPLIRLTESDMAAAWTLEFESPDGYDPLSFAGVTPSGLDGYKAVSDGYGFFDSKWGRQFAQLKRQLGITTAGTATGKSEPNHYVFNPSTGEIILDQPLAAFDTLVVSYIAVDDINSPEMMLDINDIVAKHGFPSRFNTISLAAQVAAENGATVFIPVHAGEVLQNAGLSNERLIAEPTLFTALKALEKEELVEIVVPVMQTRVYDEIIMPFYAAASHSTLTGNGQYLQEDPATGDQPGINISPLAVHPAGHPLVGQPVFLEVFLNGSKLQYNVDYSIPNLDGSTFNGSTNVAIILSSSHPNATHSVDNTLVEGDKVVANYLPDPSVIDLVATAELAVLQHCEIMSQTRNRQERTCLFGAYEFVDLDFILDPITGTQANFGSFSRSMFFFPGGYKVTRVVGGEIVNLDAQIIAAAAAGYVASHPVQETLTFKSLSGFTIPPTQKLSVDEKTLVGGAGVAIVAPLSAGGKVLHGRTTIASGDPRDEEYSVVRIKDFSAKTVRTGLGNAFIGKLIVPGLDKDVEAATKKLLSAMISQGIITSFGKVRAAVDAVDPRQMNVSFEIRPVFALNYILVEFTVSI